MILIKPNYGRFIKDKRKDLKVLLWNDKKNRKMY